MKKFTFLLTVLFLLGSFTVFAENESDNTGNKGSVAGRVVDSDLLPLPGATVLIKSIKKGVVTDVNGFYRITTLNPGEYDVTVIPENTMLP